MEKQKAKASRGKAANTTAGPFQELIVYSPSLLFVSSQ